MEPLLLISDDPSRSAALARELGADCMIYDLFAKPKSIEPTTTLIVDVADLGRTEIDRLRQIVGKARRFAPLVVLLHHSRPRSRLQAIALGATQTFTPPFDFRLLQAALNTPAVSTTPPPAEPIPGATRRQAEAARHFISAMFVPDQPITPVVIDKGTDLIEQAIRHSGIRDWILAVRQFDDATHQHCLLVAGLVAAFAASLGLGTTEQRRLTRAALLHDVGKIQVPSAILNKPGKLDPDEMELVRLHPEQGEAMLAGQGFEPEVLAVVRSHHEMLDGSGYPDGLTATAIPDLVRVITVCDIYAALIERRPYKPPMPPKRAYAVLTEMKGRLDPILVDAFLPIATAFAPLLLHDT